MSLVHLNVGGCVFATRRNTLCSGFFLGCVETLEPHETEIFIDRDPTHFRYILNWLRGSRVLPEDEQTLLELECEADFYSLDDMRQNIRETRRRFSLLRTLDVVASSM